VSTPSSQGLPSTVTSDLRPPVALAPAQVADLQSLLSAGGFYRGPIDGQLSGPTRSSVRAFQEAAHLPATGEVDAATVAALGLPSATTPSMTTPATTPSGTTPSGSAIAPPQAAGTFAPGGAFAPSASPTTTRPFPLTTPEPVAPFPESPVFIQP
jgi:peptidoglycan hydrolase-like protein with peptidoglycan-binding domain